MLVAGATMAAVERLVDFNESLRRRRTERSSIKPPNVRKRALTESHRNPTEGTMRMTLRASRTSR